MWLKMAAVGSLVPGSLTEPVAVRRLHGQNRIFLNQGGQHENFNRLASYHALEWASKAHLDARVIRPLLGNYLRFSRKDQMKRRGSKRLSLRDLPELLRLGLRIPQAFKDQRYWRQLLGCLGAAALRDGVVELRRNLSRGP